LANRLSEKQATPISVEPRKPYVEASFEETILYAEAVRKQEAAEKARRQTPVPAPTEAPTRQHALNLAESLPEDENPLLSAEEAQRKKDEERMSLFLTGAAFGAVAIGGFFFCKWIFSKKEVVEVLQEAAEESLP
jgi:hypothetical protein